MDIIESFRKEIPDFNFTTDIIVGFPGETEDDFEKTCEIAREVAFSHIHTFRYSIRNGTRASRMEDQISGKLKAERSEIIRQISDENEQKYFESMLGKTQIVLIENPDKNGSAFGYGEHYIPVKILRKDMRRNSFIKVGLNEISKENSGFMIGSVID